MRAWERLHHDAPQICPGPEPVHALERIRIEGDTVTAEPCGHKLTPEQAIDVVDQWRRERLDNEL